MMADLATMQSALEQLRSVRWGGVKRVTYEGKTIEYAPGDELERAIADLERKIEDAQGRKRPVAGFARFRRAR